MTTMNNVERISYLFHESFSLSRPSIIKILRAIQGTSVDIDFKSRNNRLKYFSDQTQLGSNYVKSMPEYCKGSGLIDFLYSVKLFGKFSIENDPLLEASNTQWLMHYYLSGPNGPGPIFWHELVKTYFRSGDLISAQEITEHIEQIYTQTESKPLAPRSARTTATIFLGTYTNSDGLGNLGILEKLSDDSYRVMDPDPPSTWVLAYALLHWWSTQFDKQVTSNLNDLYGDLGITSLFMISKGRLNSCLEEMQDEGIISLYRIAPPYQVALLRRDEGFILRKLYGV